MVVYYDLDTPLVCLRDEISLGKPNEHSLFIIQELKRLYADHLPSAQFRYPGDPKTQLHDDAFPNAQLPVSQTTQRIMKDDSYH